MSDVVDLYVDYLWLTMVIMLVVMMVIMIVIMMVIMMMYDGYFFLEYSMSYEVADVSG